MKWRLIAAGTRLPDWVNEGFAHYQKRLRTPVTLELEEIAVKTRRAGENPVLARAREGASMLAKLNARDRVVALEVGGSAMSTATLATWVAAKLRDGKPLAILIGGPDGLAPECLERADETWSLSPLTLPHALVRIVAVEQLYRAVSMLARHPYHRA